MKKTILILFLLAFCFISKAQTDSSLNQVVQTPVNPVKSHIDTNQIFSAVQNPPNFPGGRDKLNDYINLYLKQSHNQYEGNVIMQFVVERNGSLSNLKVLRGINPDADALAITIMKKCPPFNPGIQNGFSVRCYYTIPMKFTASE